MRLTERLTEEHKSIKEMLSVLGKVCEKLESGEDVDPEHVETIIDFIRGFADKCHHGKEEDLLFDAMEKAGIPSERGPIGVMLGEHDMGRGFIRGMSDALASYRLGDSGVARVIAENARSYITLLTNHIVKEDNVLYPMADARIPQEQQRELSVLFEEADRTFGAARIEGFLRSLARLKGIYLGGQ